MCIQFHVTSQNIVMLPVHINICPILVLLETPEILFRFLRIGKIKLVLQLQNENNL